MRIIIIVLIVFVFLVGVETKTIKILFHESR